MDVAATATPVSIQLDDYFAFSSDACVQVIPLIGQVFVYVFLLCVFKSLLQWQIYKYTSLFFSNTEAKVEANKNFLDISDARKVGVHSTAT